MSTHRYPRSSLITDYARGAAGVAFLALALLPEHWLLHLIFGLIALLLFGFGLRTWLRGQSRLVLDAQGLTIEGPRARRIDWQSLKALKLRYFSTRRDRKGGWMELTLVAAGGRVSIESQIEGFHALVSRAAEAAVAHGLPLDASTEGNLSALGMPLPRDRKATG